MAKLYMKPKSVQGEITESAPTAPRKKSKTTLTMQKLEQPQAKSGTGASGVSAPRKMTVAPFSTGGGQAAVRALGGIRTDGRIMKGVRSDLLGAVQTQPEGKDWEALTRKDSYYKTAQDWKAELEETEKELTAAEQKLTEAQWARNMTGAAPEGGAEWESAEDIAYRKQVSADADSAQSRVNQLKEKKTQLGKDIDQLLWTGRMRRAAEDPDFEEFAARGAAIQNPVRFARPKELKNIVTFARKNADKIALSDDKELQGLYVYNFMTDEEVKTYNYYKGKGEETIAEEYLDRLAEELNRRWGETQGKNVRDIENPVGRTVATGLFGVASGLDRFAGGIKQNFYGEQLPTSPTQFASGYIREDLADTGPKLFGHSLGQIGFDLANTAGNMAPSILASAALGPAAGAATTFASSGGNAYGEALAQGYDQRSARAYGILSGASEAGLQYALGGISALGGKAVNSEVIQSSLDNIKHAVLRIPAKYAVAAAGEMTEEYLQEILNPVFRNLALGENNEFKLVTEEAAYAALLAALSVGVMEGPHIVRENIGPAGRQSQTSAEAPGSALDSRMDVQATVDTPTAEKGVEGVKMPGEYRLNKPQNVEMPTVPIISLSVQNIPGQNSPILTVGNSLRGAAIQRARARLGLNKNSAAYIPASNVMRDGNEYVLKITKASLNKMLSPADGTTIPVESIVVMDNIERIANNGVWFESEGDRKGRDQIAGFDHLKTTVYIDGAPFEVDMRVRLVEETAGQGADNVLYYFTPEEILGIKKVDTQPPTGERHALTVGSEGTPTSKNRIPQTPGVVNHESGGVRGVGEVTMDTPTTQNPVEGMKKAPVEGAGGNVRLTETDTAEYMATGKKKSVRDAKAAEVERGGKVVLTTAQETQEFIGDAIRGVAGQTTKAYGRIGAGMAVDIQAVSRSNIDVTGWFLELVPDDLRHAFEQHAKAKREGNIDLTEQDFLNIPDYIDSYDDILEVRTFKTGDREVVVGKKINGYSVIVELMSNNRKSLHFKNMWGLDTQAYESRYGKSTASHPGRSSVSANDPTEVYHGTSSMDSIPQTPGGVNPEAGGGMPNGVGAAERGFAGTYDQLQWQTPASGFHPDGERSARQVDVPARDFDGRNIPKSAATVMEAQATPDSTVEDIQRLIAGGALSFDSITDDAALRRAERTIRQDGYEEALGAWLERAGRGVISKDLVVEGQLLLNSAMNSRATGDVIRILGAYTLMSTTAAQSLQAQRVLKQLTPEWQLYAVQQSLASFQNDLNQRLGDKAPTIEVDAALYDAFLAAPAGTEARDAALKAIYQNVADQIPASFMDKWNAWRYLSMLGNPRTHIRNIGGNAAFAPVRGVKNALAWGMENTVNLVSKRAGGDGITKTKSVILPLLSRLSKTDGALVKACYQDIENVKPQLLGQGKYAQSAQGQIDQARTIFKLKPLEATRNANSTALDAEDTWFSYPAYAGALAGYLKANGVTAQMMTEGTVDTTVLEGARVWAIREAQRATYRDANAISDFIANIGYKGKSKVGKAVNTMVEGVLPFKRTPANILARGLEYSPAGLVKGLTADLYQVKKGRMTAAQAIDNIAAGLTGSGLLALGAWLASIGLVTGGGGDDEADRMNDLTGGQDYALSLPGGYNVTLDWLAPEALPFFMGVELFNAMSDNKDGGVTLENIEEAALKVADPLMEMSMLQSLQDAIDAVKFSDGGTLLRVAANAGVSYLSQGVPTLFGQVERTLETERGTTYVDRTSGIPKNVQYLLGKSMNKTPGEYQQIPYIDAWGRREETGSPWIRAINNFANPAYVSQKNETAADKEIRRLLDAGQTGVVPKRAPQSQKIGKEYLNKEEYVRFATMKGETSLRLVTELIGSSQYKAMSDKDKAEAIQKAYTYAGETAKAAIRP